MCAQNAASLENERKALASLQWQNKQLEMSQKELTSQLMRAMKKDKQKSNLIKELEKYVEQQNEEMERDKNSLRMLEAKFHRENNLQASNQSIVDYSPVLRSSNVLTSESPIFTNDRQKEEPKQLLKRVILVKSHMERYSEEKQRRMTFSKRRKPLIEEQSASLKKFKPSVREKLSKSIQYLVEYIQQEKPTITLIPIKMDAEVE